MKAKRFKTYEIEASSLYKLRSKKKLAERLGLSLQLMHKLCGDEHYSEWEDISSGKPRTIQAPQGDLKKAHARFTKLLSRVASPSWVISGKKGVSYVDNSTIHVGAKYALNVDIRKFYPNSQREFVFRAFRDIFLMAEDVASFLADFLTYKQHIPTGSSASQVVAYWSFKSTFDRINQLALDGGYSTSLYVDDLTFSGDRPFGRKFLRDIEVELKKVKHSISHNKTRISGVKDYKKITGVSVSPNGEKKVPNKLRHSIVKKLREKSYDGLTLAEVKSLLGKIVAGRQIEPDFMEVSYQRLTRINRVMSQRTR